MFTGKTVGSTAKYGVFNVNKKQTYVHRWMYTNTVGPIPEGYEIDHVAARGCIYKTCINPAHLEPVTHGENRRRGRLTTCRAGLHDLTDPVNMRWDSDGNRRGCLRCWEERAKERAHV